MLSALVLAAAAAVAAQPRAASSGADWTQWGGPGRNFMSESKGLAASWPAL